MNSSGSLTKAQRLDYVNAVKCLQSLPPRTPASVASGARSRVCLYAFARQTCDDR